jgi:hypothetical protein
MYRQTILYYCNNWCCYLVYCFASGNSTATIEPGAKAPFEIIISTDKVKGGDLSIIDHFSAQPSS